MIRIEYSEQSELLAGRQVLARPCEDFFRDAILEVSPRCSGPEDWTLSLAPSLMFDSSGLLLLINALKEYSGPASEIRFRLALDPDAYRDYYSLGPESVHHLRLLLPVTARRSAVGSSGSATLDIEFDYCTRDLEFPSSLADVRRMNTPLALLMECHGEFDILFANQVAIFSALARDLRRHPLAWAKAILSRRRGSWKQRLGLAYTRIHPDADVHPTAVVEGSVIAAGARVGAHCVVRYSHIGERAELSDGAKVEFSVVGPGSWLMHDLVIFRCHVEDEVFLIHGPYQFSCFQSRSAAFATIMMDYRPDAKPIKAMTDSGLREYHGGFLGSVLKEGAKSLGGSLLSPGMIIPGETWLAGDLASIHRPGRLNLPQRQPLPASFDGRDSQDCPADSQPVSRRIA